MKKLFYLFVLCFAQSFVQAQDIKFDGLNAPTSPAFNLLGISPSSIDQPTDLTSFAVSIQNATNDFNSIPSNYAMEFLPFTLFGQNSMTTKELDETGFKDVFKQTFSISLGVTNEIENEEDSTIPNLTKLGLGLKFSIIRPSFDDTTKSDLYDLYTAQNDLINAVADMQFNDDILNNYIELKKEIAALDISEQEKAVKLREIIILEKSRKKELLKEYKEDLKSIISEKAKALKFKRSGMFLDFACGSVIDFKNETFNRSQISKVGAWLTGGYTSKKSLDILGIGRYLYQPDKLLADDTGLIDTENMSSLDGGVRIVYKTLKKEQLSLSAESIYRSVLNSSILDPSWRFVCNTSYDFGNNKVVTFSFGKDFDNSLIKGNNLIAALNFIIGFGNAVNNNTDAP
ncbi:hypothetical protein [Flavobacterium sp.]|uniref:hypothetical protein n=1 Tax=Flavobacterium sp. TaxID=239 RepID=UPI0026231C04|nr:hypothetical protein [Flavobacterium sp.]